MKTEKTKTVTEQLGDVFIPWNRTDAPGLTVGVAKDGKTMYRRGFGMASLETGVAHQPKTRMRIGSISKHFTGLLALLLAEEGKLDLDAPIRTYVPELTGPGGDPTLRLLLQHRGGSYCSLDLAFLGHALTPPPLGSALATQARLTGRNFAPGEAMIYNNAGYHLVSIAIERVGGVPFEAQLKQRLFDPTGMVDTDSVLSDYIITPGIATMHIPLPDGRWSRGLFPSEEIRGEGGIVSTIDDMLRWTAHLRTRDKFGSAATWAALTERPVFPDGVVGDYALGLMIGSYRGARIVQHSGGLVGGLAQMLTFPELGVDIVILVNGAPHADPVKLSEHVADIVLAGRLGDPVQPLVAADYRALLGEWWSPETGMAYGLIDEEGILKLTMCGSPFGFGLARAANNEYVVASAAATGAIRMQLDEAARNGDLPIRFGGRTASYRKLLKEEVDAETFARAAIGTYASEDAGSTASLSRDGERLLLTFTDPYGQFATATRPLSESVAFIEPAVISSFPIYAQINLILKNGRATGFNINTGRTRNLVFNRVDS